MPEVSGESEDQPPSGDQKPAAGFDGLIESLLANLKGSTDFAAIERALTLAKLNSEIQKLNSDKNKADQEATKAAVDASLAAKQLRHSLTSSMLAPLVPITSLATVMVTLVIGYVQTNAAREQARDKTIEDRAARDELSWKAFEDDLNKSSADALYASGTFLSRLHAFDANGNRRVQLGDITKQFMARLSSDAAFKDIWAVSIKGTRAENFQTVIDLARGKTYQSDVVIADCVAIKMPDVLVTDPSSIGLGPCSPKYSQVDIIKAFPEQSVQRNILSLRQSKSSLDSIIWFLSLEISSFLRETSAKEKGGKPYDLSKIVIMGSNLDNVDFSQMNLAETTISQSTVNGAVLSAATMMYNFLGTPWWEADIIDQAILPYQITYNFPENPWQVFPGGYKISLDQYRAKISKLCTGKMLACTEDCLRFGQRSVPTAPEVCAANP